MVIIAQSIQEASDFIGKIVEDKLAENRIDLLRNISQFNHPQFKYASDFISRTILSGDPDKPISKKIFNRLRAQGKITTYYPSEGRTAYKVSELYAYIETTKKNIK